MRKLLFAILLTTLAASCSKNNDNDTPPKPVEISKFAHAGGESVDLSELKIPKTLKDGIAYKDSVGNIICFGMNPDTLWVASFDEKGNIVQQITIDSVPYKIYSGYGEYKEKPFIVGPYPKTSKKGDVVLFFYVSYGGRNSISNALNNDVNLPVVTGFITINDNDRKVNYISAKATDVDGLAWFSSSLLNWADGGYLLNYDSYCIYYDKNLNVIDTFKKDFPINWSRFVDDYNFIKFLNKSQAIVEENKLQIRCVDLNKEGEIWNIIYSDLLDDLQSNAKYSRDSISVKDGVLSVSFNITNFDATKETRTYKIDITTGKLL